MVISIYRTLVIYLIVLIVIRLMGKREIGQISSFDLVVALIIAELAAIPMEQTSIPLWQGIAPIITLTTLQLAISYSCLKWNWLRDLIYGKPNILIRNGKIIEEEMRKSRYNIEDLLTQLRQKNVPNVADVEFAILESSGQLSIIPQSQKRPLTPADLHIPTKYEGLCLPLIIDGEVQETSIKQAGLSREWLMEEMRKKGITKIEEVFFASLDTQGKIYVDVREG